MNKEDVKSVLFNARSNEKYWRATATSLKKVDVLASAYCDGLAESAKDLVDYLASRLEK